MTLEQNLNYFSKIYSIKNRKYVIVSVIKLLELEEYRHIVVKKLSGGTKKRVDLACALLNSPDILVLDEPFSGLDSFLVNSISNFLRGIEKMGVTIVLSSHLLDQVGNLCNRFFFIDNKKMTEITKERLVSLYKQ